MPAGWAVWYIAVMPGLGDAGWIRRGGLLVVVVLTACNGADSLRMEGAVPAELWSDIPVLLPRVTALSADGRDLPNVAVEVRVDPAANARVENGRLVAVHHGAAVVRWSVPGTDLAQSKSVDVMVPDALDVTCPTTPCTVRVGEQLRLKATVRRGAEILGAAPVMWTSAEPKVLEGRAPGVFAARTAGPASVTAVLGTLSKTIPVRVSAAKVDDVELACAQDPTVPDGDDGACVVKIGRDRGLRIRLMGGGQTALGFDRRWKVKDRRIARIVDDKLSGLQIGRTTVTLTAGGKTATLPVEVWPAACSEKVQAVLTYIIPEDVPRRGYQSYRQRRYRRYDDYGRLLPRKVQLACRVPEPESCITFYKEERDLTYPDAFESCCCRAQVR